MDELIGPQGPFSAGAVRRASLGVTLLVLVAVLMRVMAARDPKFKVPLGFAILLITGALVVDDQPVPYTDLGYIEVAPKLKQVKATPEPRRWAVCITGQLSRLELESKLTNLIQPLSEVVDALDVVLVLDDTKAEFVNHEVSGGVDLAPFGSLEQVSEFLGKARGLEKPIAELRVVRKVQPEAPLVNPEYVKKLDKGLIMTESQQMKRGAVHLRQWYHLWECMHALTSIESELSVTYDGILRLRDDLHMVDPADANQVVEALDPDSVLTLPCEGWGGINDKIAAVGRKSMRSYFEAPLMDYLLYSTVVTKNVWNPESYMKQVLLRHGVKLNKLPGIIAMPQVFQSDLPGYCLKFAGTPGTEAYAEIIRCYAGTDEALFSRLEGLACKKATESPTAG